MANIKVDFEPEQYIDRYGYLNAKLIRQDLRKDMSSTIVIVGKERKGKSTLADIFAACVDETLDTNHVVFPTTELKRAIAKSPENCYRVILQDEGAETWLSDEAQGADAKEMVRMMMETGYKNLCIIILIPDYAKVQRYLKAHRIDALIRIVKRGTYHFYSESRSKAIRINHDTKQINWGKPNFVGHYRPFPKMAFWQEIQRKKKEHLGHKEENPKILEERQKAEKLLRNTCDSRAAARMLGMSLRQFLASIKCGFLSDFKVKPIMYGQRKRWAIKDVLYLNRCHKGGNIDALLQKVEDADEK